MFTHLPINPLLILTPIKKKPLPIFSIIFICYFLRFEARVECETNDYATQFLASLNDRSQLDLVVELLEGSSIEELFAVNSQATGVWIGLSNDEFYVPACESDEPQALTDCKRKICSSIWHVVN